MEAMSAHEKTLKASFKNTDQMQKIARHQGGADPSSSSWNGGNYALTFIKTALQDFRNSD